MLNKAAVLEEEFALTHKAFMSNICGQGNTPRFSEAKDIASATAG